MAPSGHDVSPTEVLERVTVTCNCETTRAGNDELLEAFGRVRQGCVALRDLLAPDDAWQAIAQTANAPPSAALHCSYLLAAFQRDVLHRITRPIHRFLCDGQSLKATITTQYRRDLAERWLQEAEHVARHERFRRFFGKVVELQVAGWLEDTGWKIEGLEALGANSDIVARSRDTESWVIDVKYIGQETDDFMETMKALASDGTSATSGTLYGGINYLLFRVFEGSRGLANRDGRKLVAIVIDALAWPTFDVPLRHGWVDWNCPSFLSTSETDWNNFVAKQRVRYPDLDSQVRNRVSELDGLIVFSVSGCEYSVQFQRWGGLTTGCT